MTDEDTHWRRADVTPADDLPNPCPAESDRAGPHEVPLETVFPDTLRFRYWLLNPVNLSFTLLSLTPGVLFLTIGERDGGWCCLGLSAAVWLVVMAVGSWRYYAAPRSRLPRSVTVRGGEVVVAYRTEGWTAPLAESAWHLGTTRSDETLLCTPRTPAVVISCPGHEPVACGLTPESYQQWVEFLTRAGVRSRGLFPWARVLVACPVGLATGMAVGWAVGTLLAATTGDGRWAFALTLLGGFDGLLAPAVAVGWGWYAPGHSKREEWRWAGPLFFAVGFAALALLLFGARRGIGMGWPATLVVMALNACLGWVMGRVAGRLAWPTAEAGR